MEWVKGLSSCKKRFWKIVKDLTLEYFLYSRNKAQDDEVSEALKGISDYELFTNSADKKG